MARLPIIVIMVLLFFHQTLSQQGSPDPVGTFHLINAHGLCLASEANWGDNDNNLVEWECLPEMGQQWSFNNSDLGSGDRRICNEFKKCITAVPEEDRLVQFDPIDGNGVQQFTLVPSDRNGYWYIKNDDGDCLSGDSNIGSLITLSTCTYNSPFPLWKRLKLNPGGSLSLPIVDPMTSPTVIPLLLPNKFPQLHPLLLPPLILPTWNPSSSLPTLVLPTTLPETTTSAAPSVLSTWIPPWAFSVIERTPLLPTSSLITKSASSRTFPPFPEFMLSGFPTAKTEPTVTFGTAVTWVPTWIYTWIISHTSTIPTSVKSSTVSPTEVSTEANESINESSSSSNPTPLLWVLYGPIDLSNTSAFWPFNLPPFENNSLSLNRSLKLPEIFERNSHLEGSISMNYPFHN